MKLQIFLIVRFWYIRHHNCSKKAGISQETSSCTLNFKCPDSLATKLWSYKIRFYLNGLILWPQHFTHKQCLYSIYWRSPWCESQVWNIPVDLRTYSLMRQSTWNEGEGSTYNPSRLRLRLKCCRLGWQPHCGSSKNPKKISVYWFFDTRWRVNTVMFTLPVLNCMRLAFQDTAGSSLSEQSKSLKTVVKPHKSCDTISQSNSLSPSAIPTAQKIVFTKPCRVLLWVFHGKVKVILNCALPLYNARLQHCHQRQKMLDCLLSLQLPLLVANWSDWHDCKYILV